MPRLLSLNCIAALPLGLHPCGVAMHETGGLGQALLNGWRPPRRPTDVRSMTAADDVRRMTRRRLPARRHADHSDVSVSAPSLPFLLAAGERARSQRTRRSHPLRHARGHRLRRWSSGTPAAIGLARPSASGLPPMSPLHKIGGGGRRKWWPTATPIHGATAGEDSGGQRPSHLPWRADAPEAMAIPVYSQIDSWLCGI